MLTYEDFSISLWDNISNSVITDQIYEINEEFFKAETFEFYRIYDRLGGDVPLFVFSRLLESFVVNATRHDFEF